MVFTSQRFFTLSLTTWVDLIISNRESLLFILSLSLLHEVIKLLHSFTSLYLKHLLARLLLFDYLALVNSVYSLWKHSCQLLQTVTFLFLYAGICDLLNALGMVKCVQECSRILMVDRWLLAKVKRQVPTLPIILAAVATRLRLLGALED